MNRAYTVTLATSCALFAAATGAFAADADYHSIPSGYYLAVSGGLVQIFDIDTNAPGASPLGGSGDMEFNYGARGALAVGKHLSDNVRAEIEFAGTSTNADSFHPDAGANFNLSGSLQVYSLLAKVDYEMEIFSWWHPYLGVGLGGAIVSADNIGPSGSPNSVDGSDAAFAAAVETGSKFRLSDNIDLFTQTQLMVLSDVDIGSNTSLNTPLILSSSVGLRIGF